MLADDDLGGDRGAVEGERRAQAGAIGNAGNIFEHAGDFNEGAAVEVVFGEALSRDQAEIRLRARQRAFAPTQQARACRPRQFNCTGLSYPSAQALWAR